MGIIYDNGEIIIEHKSEDLYITGYKAEKKRYAVRLDEQDFIGVKNWALDFKPGAEVWTRYKEDYNGRWTWTIVRLYDKNGEEAHILEACGDGRFKENDYSYWCEATLEAFDSDGEFSGSQTLGFIAEPDAKRWVW